MPTFHPTAAAAAAGAAALLLPASLLSTAPSAAAATDFEAPRPPARMSTVGGKRLGLPGTQVDRRPGAPALPKNVTSRSWIVADAETGEVLAAHNAHWRLPPASTLKMLFADLLLPRFPKDTKHKVVGSELADLGAGSSLVGLKEEQTYTVRDLWLGVFLRSGNDAVHALSAMNGGTEKTVREMNQHARMLRARDTHVVTPDGYDAKGQVSSAYDLTLFARHGLQKEDFRKYAATVRAEFPGEERKGKKRETFEIQNTNRLLTGGLGYQPYPGVAGVKNGYTSKAGQTLTAVAQRGHRVLLVTAMRPERNGAQVYKETAALLDWGFKAADRVVPVGVLVPPDVRGKRHPGGDEAGGVGAGRSRTEGEEGGKVSAGPNKPTGGAGTAVAVTGVSLTVLAVAAYVVHRRWPRPGMQGRRRG